MKKISLFVKAGVLMISTFALFGCSGPPEPPGSIKFYVGSSNPNLSRSIFLCELDRANNSFATVDSFAGVRAGSYLALSPEQKFLFAISQEPWSQDAEDCTVASYSVEPGTLALKLINSQSSEGSDICHIYCSKKGDYIFAANYGNGYASALPVLENGEIAPATSVVTGEGSGPVESRQQGPHAHMVILDPGQNFLLVPDLGIDKVMIYAFDHENGTLTPNPAQPYFQLAPGAGPRHLAFHPDGKSLYIVNELNATITACSYNGADGTITELNTLSTVEASHTGMKYPAEVRVHPNGKYVYASTRGENSCITCFQINDDRSVTRLQVMEQVPNWPRDFNLDPEGSLMIVAGERADEIRLYTINPENGMMAATDGRLKLPAPASVLFIQ
jgi:6-phosphogluconolactonase